MTNDKRLMVRLWRSLVLVRHVTNKFISSLVNAVTPESILAFLDKLNGLLPYALFKKVDKHPR